MNNGDHNARRSLNATNCLGKGELGGIHAGVHLPSGNCGHAIGSTNNQRGRIPHRGCDFRKPKWRQLIDSILRDLGELGLSGAISLRLARAGDQCGRSRLKPFCRNIRDFLQGARPPLQFDRQFSSRPLNISQRRVWCCTSHLGNRFTHDVSICRRLLHSRYAHLQFATRCVIFCKSLEQGLNLRRRGVGKTFN